jgi:hypothetical protein
LIDNQNSNIEKTNKVLAEFGSPYLFDTGEKDIILQIGVEPNLIDIMLKIDNVQFDTAWEKRVRNFYGDLKVNWIGIESLIRSKSNTGKARHDEDVKILQEIRKKLK